MNDLGKMGACAYILILQERKPDLVKSSDEFAEEVLSLNDRFAGLFKVALF